MGDVRRAVGGWLGGAESMSACVCNMIQLRLRASALGSKARMIMKFARTQHAVGVCRLAQYLRIHLSCDIKM